MKDIVLLILFLTLIVPIYQALGPWMGIPLFLLVLLLIDAIWTGITEDRDGD